MKYGYARVSSIIQLSGNSLEEQQKKLVDAGVEMQNIVVEQYSGKTMLRPLFNELIAKLQTGDELVCCKLDRFARNAEDGLRVVRQLTEKGVAIRILNISNGQPFDNTPVGQLLFTMLLAFAEFERSLLIERTAAGKVIARTKNGYHEGRPRIPKAKINHALELLVTHSYNQVAEITGISVSTIQRYVRVEKEKLAKVPRRKGYQGPEDELSLFAYTENKRPGRRKTKK